MRNIYTLLIMVAVFAVSCKKYDDGPMLSLRTKKARLTNTWKIEKYLVNDVDKTSDAQTLFAGYKLTVSDNGNYSVYYKALNIADVNESGTWEFTSDKEEVIFTQTSPNSNTSIWRILKLKNDELWGKFTNASNGDITEVHLIPN